MQVIERRIGRVMARYDKRTARGIPHDPDRLIVPFQNVLERTVGEFPSRITHLIVGRTPKRSQRHTERNGDPLDPF